MNNSNQEKTADQKSADADKQEAREAEPVDAGDAVLDGIPIADAADGIPVAKAVLMDCASDDVTYVGVAAGPYASYLVRSDGGLDRTISKGEIAATLTPKPGTKYLQASAGEHATYAVRDDGVIARILSATDVKEINAPSQTRYVSVTSGEYASYFLREDGAVDRTTGGGKVSTTINPPPGIKYVGVSAGTHASYFLRDDGSVDRTKGSGKISETMAPPEGTNYVSVAAGEFASYLVRDDGIVDRTKGYGKIDSQMSPPAGTKYVRVSDMFAVTTQHSPNGAHKDSPGQMYLVREDGAVDRTRGYGTIELTMNPPPGLKYTSASSGLHASYLLQSNGVVARTTGGGKVGKQAKASGAGAGKSEGGCVVM